MVVATTIALYANCSMVSSGKR
ncbi:BnaC06g06910D [Brassica napus]|uniref:BnaC06g06910D protein n=1 Tax=Brassica napus TaxID=3708 RepID=A0A078H8A6_BRANA|nr:BnaC06g06910D [Brassica napus]